jgi:soluble lytic murein transglycosylase-like protein
LCFTERGNTAIFVDITFTGIVSRKCHFSNAYDPQQNIFAGAKYLSWLLKRFNGNTQMALAAYNAGEGNVDKYGGMVCTEVFVKDEKPEPDAYRFWYRLVTRRT